MVLLLNRKFQLLHSKIYLFFFFFLTATLGAYESSQARGPIGAAAACLHHSFSNARSEPCLQPTPWFTAMLDPLTH